MQIIERPCLVAEYNETPFMKYQNYSLTLVAIEKAPIFSFEQSQTVELKWIFKKVNKTYKGSTTFIKSLTNGIYNMNYIYSGQAIATVLIVIPNNVEVY